MDLFLDRLPEQDDSFRKEAAFAARLSESPENWPQELNSELFKQLPFLSDYNVNVNLDRVEKQRGFAFGYADISNKTERPEVEHEEAGLPHIRIPLVIMERAVKPFSIFLDGERVLPLTEERVREILFNPQTFDISSQPPRDPSLVEATMPPQRSGMGMGGEYKMAAANTDEHYGFGNDPEHKAHENAYNRLREAHPDKKMGKTYAKAMGGSTIGGAALGALAGHILHRKGMVGNQALSIGEARKLFGRTGAILGAYGSSVGSAVHYAVRRQHHIIDQKTLKKHGPEYAKYYNEEKAKTSSVLLAIAPTISERDVEAFTEKVASDPTLIAGFNRSGVAPLLIEVFENTKRASADERLLALAEKIEPTVITFQKLPGGDFLVKSANVHAFVQDKLAAGEVVPGQEAAQAIGPEQAQAMQPGQTATATSEPVEPEQEEAPDPMAQPEESDSKVIEEFGEYLVQDTMGNRLLGWVFPQVLAWDESFSPQPIALFTNGSAYALQDAIAGELVGKGTTMPSDAPRGDGVFYTTQNGKASCTAPIMIGSSMAGPDGLPRFVGTDVFGNQIQVSQTEGLKVPQRITDAEYAVPDSWKFMRLNNQTQLVPDPVQMNKAASVRRSQNEVTMFYNGGYNIVGGCGLDKIATSFRYDLDPVSAEFMLGLLGVDGATAKVKVAEARRKGNIKLAGLKSITLLSERFSESTKTASALLKEFPNLKRDLIKEAASMQDEGTVDNLLALNFINPENLETFISYMPELEQTSEKLAEMLLFSYLGMKELPEGAIERGMKNLEEVLVGLKAAAHSGGAEQ